MLLTDVDLSTPTPPLPIGVPEVLLVPLLVNLAALAVAASKFDGGRCPREVSEMGSRCAVPVRGARYSFGDQFFHLFLRYAPGRYVGFGLRLRSNFAPNQAKLKRRMAPTAAMII
jgi:hypothetical protein